MGESSPTATTTRHSKPRTVGDAEEAAQVGSFSFDTPEGVLYANELMRGRLWVGLCVLFSLGGMAASVAFDQPGPEAAGGAVNSKSNYP